MFQVTPIRDDSPLVKFHPAMVTACITVMYNASVGRAIRQGAKPADVCIEKHTAESIAALEAIASRVAGNRATVNAADLAQLLEAACRHALELLDGLPPSEAPEAPEAPTLVRRVLRRLLRGAWRPWQ